MKPTSVNVIGKVYSVEYVDNPALVDNQHRQSLWGQIDYWERSIRVYDNGRSAQDVLHTLIHELLHGIVTEMHMGDAKIDDETTVDILALALADMLTRNDWLRDAE